MNYKIISKPAIKDLIQDAASLLISCIKNKDVLLLLSGGSALKIIEAIDGDQLNNRITISVLDERYSTHTEINNFAQIVNTKFYQLAKTNGCNFIDTRPLEDETIVEMAGRFEHDLRNWKTAHQEGEIIATQGIGPDGHTSGIMPFPENVMNFNTLFNNTERWVQSYDAGVKNEYPLRVTTTIPFLKMIDHSIVFATGENKKEVIKKALSPDSKLQEVPSKIIQEMKNVYLYTDQIVE